MASRLLQPARRAFLRSHAAAASPAQRSFQTSRPRFEAAGDAAPARKPVGAFRGGLFGFLFGSVAAGSAIYFYVLSEYKVSNELLTEDIYALQAAVQRVEGYVRNLEERVAEVSKKKK